MDKFNLREYLKNNPLLKEEMSEKEKFLRQLGTNRMRIEDMANELGIDDIPLKGSQQLYDEIWEKYQNSLEENNPLLKEGVSQWLIDSFIEGVEDQSQFGEEWNIHAEAGTEDYDNLITAAEEVIAGTDSEDTTEEELIAAAQAQLNGGDKVTYYAEDEIASRVRKLGKENGIANADIEEYVGELSGFFEPDAYKNTTDAELLDDLKIYLNI